MNDDPFFAYVERLREAQGSPAPSELTAGAESDPVYDLLSHDALFGSQYAYDEGGLSPENEDFQIGGRMVLEGFDASEVAGAVYLRPRLAIPDQAYKLEVNGVQRDVSCVEADAGELTLRCLMVGGDGKLFNESNALVYDSAQALLDASGELAYETFPLWETAYEAVQDKGRYVIYKSAAAFEARGDTALVANGIRWQWQPTYGLSQAGQYAVDGEGHVWIAAGKDTAADGAALARWLEEQEAELYAFDG